MDAESMAASAAASATLRTSGHPVATAGHPVAKAGHPVAVGKKVGGGWKGKGGGGGWTTTDADDTVLYTTTSPILYDMHLISVKDLLELDRLLPHQELLRAGKLVKWEGSMAGRTLFVSHRT